MKRFREGVFENLQVWLIGSGGLAGLLAALVLSSGGTLLGRPFHWIDFLVLPTVGAGLGWAGSRLAEKIVRTPLRDQVLRMREVVETMREASIVKDWNALRVEQLLLPSVTDDELGQAAETFNELVTDLARVYKLEDASTEQTETLSSLLDLGSLSGAALELLLRQTEADAGCLLVMQDGELVTPANFGLSDVDGLADSDRVQLAMETGRMQSVRVPRDISMDGVICDFRPRQVLLLPITYEGYSLGVVVLAAETMFGRDSMWILDLFTKGMGLALNNALTHDRLQKIASLDPLTGVYNRRLGMIRLHEEFQRAERESADLGLAMFDIDHFKRINDTYGHLVGDKVLAAVARATADVLRETDVLVRYGGEEFLVVLPGVSPGEIEEMGERIRTTVEACVLESDQGAVQATVSVGLTNYSTGSEILEEELLKEADDALYAAKESGRNRVVRFSNCSDDTRADSPPEASRPVACSMP